MLHPDLDVIVVNPDDFGSGMALRAGASRVLSTGSAAVEELAASDGGRVLRPTGMFVLVGGAGKQPVDWSLVWNRQLTVQGTINFGPEPALGGRQPWRRSWSGWATRRIPWTAWSPTPMLSMTGRRPPMTAPTRIPIPVQDLTWLNMDRPNNLMAITGMMWFREPPDWERFLGVVQERIVQRYPVFGRRPVEVGGTWHWEDDASFSLDHHVRRVTLDPPSDAAALLRHLSSRHSTALDKSRPLWGLDLIDGVTGIDPGGPVCVLVARFHHAIADGIRLVQVLLTLLDSDAEATPHARVGRTMPAQSRALSTAATEARRTLGDVTALTVRAVRTGAGAARSLRPRTVAAVPGSLVRGSVGLTRRPLQVVDALAALSSPENRLVNNWASATKLILAGSAPTTVWSGTPGTAKSLRWVSGVDLPAVKTEARRHGASVNDVLMSAVAGGLRRYLRGKGDTGTHDLGWLIPVSLRPLDENLPRALGNHFALVNLALPVGIADPVARLEEVTARMARLKHSDEALMVFGLQRVVGQAPTTIAVNLTNMVANRNTGVLTNIPGPTTAMQLAGARVGGLVGWNPTSGDQPIGVCLFSYRGEVTVGVNTDDDLIPDPDHVLACIAAEFESTGLGDVAVSGGD